MGTLTGWKTQSTPRNVDPLSRYVRQLLFDLESHTLRRPGSAAICLGAFARLGKLDGEVPRIVRALARAIRSDMLDEVDLWLCSTALRTVVSSNPSACADCAVIFGGLTEHRCHFVVEDVTLALSCLEKHLREQPYASRRRRRPPLSDISFQLA